MALNVFSTTLFISSLLLGYSSYWINLDYKSLIESTPTILDGSRDVDVVFVMDRTHYIHILHSVSSLDKLST